MGRATLRRSTGSKALKKRLLPGITASLALASLVVTGFVAPAGAEGEPSPDTTSAVTQEAVDPAVQSPESPAAAEPTPPVDVPAESVPTPSDGPTTGEEPAATPDPPATEEPSGGEVLGPPVPETDLAPDPAPEPEPTTPDDAEEDPGVTPFVVPPATGNDAVVTVKVGGDRTSLVAVGPLAGVTLQLYDGVGAPTAPVADAWATCVSDADGDCSFVVPNTQVGGANRDRRFWVVQTGVPADWYTNLTLGTGSSGSTQTPYRFRTGTLLQAGSTYSSQGSFMLGTGNANNVASGGIWQTSRVNPTFPAQCGIDVALVLDLSGSVAADLPQLKQAANRFVDALTGTPSNMGLFTFRLARPRREQPQPGPDPGLDGGQRPGS